MGTKKDSGRHEGFRADCLKTIQHRLGQRLWRSPKVRICVVRFATQHVRTFSRHFSTPQVVLSSIQVSYAKQRCNFVVHVSSPETVAVKFRARTHDLVKRCVFPQPRPPEASERAMRGDDVFGVQYRSELLHRRRHRGQHAFVP
eukprot:31119-Pelagococcus_subviridis.AAC.1